MRFLTLSCACVFVRVCLFVCLRARVCMMKVCVLRWWLWMGMAIGVGRRVQIVISEEEHSFNVTSQKASFLLLSTLLLVHPALLLHLHLLEQVVLLLLLHLHLPSRGQEARLGILRAPQRVLQTLLELPHARLQLLAQGALDVQLCHKNLLLLLLLVRHQRIRCKPDDTGRGRRGGGGRRR